MPSEGSSDARPSFITQGTSRELGQLRPIVPLVPVFGVGGNSHASERVRRGPSAPEPLGGAFRGGAEMYVLAARLLADRWSERGGPLWFVTIDIDDALGCLGHEGVWSALSTQVSILVAAALMRCISDHTLKPRWEGGGLTVRASGQATGCRQGGRRARCYGILCWTTG